MNCENNMCIYWKDNECILSEISIDCAGNCTECIYVDIDEEILNEARNKFFSTDADY